jgi:RNA polymerase sigma-70 factor (ECF subfamily)
MAMSAMKSPPKGHRTPRGQRWADDPDVGLMLRVQDDEAEAFAELVERYRSRIFGHFVRRLGDRQDAEDLTQEVFLRLYRHRKRYRPRAKFTTWLFHIIHNLACNALRSRQYRSSLPWNRLPLEQQERSRDDAATVSEGSPSRPLERAELAGVVREAVGELAGRQRAAVELHQFHDRTYAEVAAELNMTPKAAKSLLYRARIQLRSSLASFVEAQ